jgi:two-component system response regulator HydG
MAHLIVLAGQQRGMVHQLPEQEQPLRLGRDRAAEIRLIDHQISRFHAALRWSPTSGFMLEDLGSRNGCYLNGAHCTRARLAHGDELRLGNTVLLFSDGRPATGADASAQATRAAEGTRAGDSALPAIIGDSPAMLDVLRLVAKAARAPVTVLVRGESGTGKELIAHAIHHGSPQANGPLVILNCSTLHGDLLNSELFGHERGAFTGALERRPGAFERAADGTLFLDEIGELPLETQATLLRVVEGKGFTRLGGTERVTPQVRLIAATHRDLRSLVSEGRFREDLYFRLAVLELYLPALRERDDDVPRLAQYFLERAASKLVGGSLSFSPAALDLLQRYRWPGNVRELRNVIERVAILADTTTIEPRDLPPEIQAAAASAIHVAAPSETGSASLPTRGPFPSLDQLERHHIEHALALAGGNKSRAARLLGIDRMTLYNRLKRYGTATSTDDHEAD